MREGNVPGVRAAVPFLGNAPYAPALVTSTARSSPMSARRACPRENNALRRPVPAVSRDRLDGGIPDAAVEGGHQAVAWATAMTTATPRRPVERMWVWGVVLWTRLCVLEYYIGGHLTSLGFRLIMTL